MSSTESRPRWNDLPLSHRVEIVLFVLILALGAALGTLAVAVRQEVALFIMGGVFVVETVSVMLQVASYRWRGKNRVFRMAPLHHHF